MRKFAPLILLCILALRGNLLAQTDVTTQHNDLGRTGWNSQETILNTGNVSSSTFGKIFSRTVDDRMYAQPLVVSGVSVAAGTKNVVFAATVNNTVYAFDADDPNTPNPYWQVTLTPPGSRPPANTDMHAGFCTGSYSDFKGNMGIVGTPVIDKASNTLYVVYRYVTDPVDNHAYTGDETTYTSTGFFQVLAALDIRTGALKNKITIVASTAGTGDGAQGGIVSFDPRREFNRAGLALSGGIVYVSFAAHCDWNPYHGWLLGYDATSLTQRIVYCPTPNDGRGGIWMSGTAPAVDETGNILMAVGNGKAGDPTDPLTRGESVVKLTPNTSLNTIALTSYFTPSTYKSLNDNDLDFGTQVMLIPGSNLAMTGLKSGDLFLLDRTNSLGGYSTTSNNVLFQTNIGISAYMHSNFAYFKNETTEFVYQASENTHTKSYPLNRAGHSLGASTDNAVNNPTGLTGGFMSVSSNGNLSTSGILWLYQAESGCSANQNDCQGVLRALKASDITTELWNSDMNSFDPPGLFTKMSAPTIANGKVYLPTYSKSLVVYGNKSASCASATNVALNKPALASTTQPASGGNTFVAANAFDGNTSTLWASSNADNQWVYVDLGAIYDICGVTLTWDLGTGKDFNIDVSNDATTWTTIQAVTGNSSRNNSFNVTASGRYVRMFGIHRVSTSFPYAVKEMSVFGQTTNPCPTAPTLLAPTNLSTNTVTLNWQAVAGATSYLLQYKAGNVAYWTSVPTTSTAASLSALSCGTDYSYRLQTICASGSSPFVSAGFTTAACGYACSLPTRYLAADIGTVGVAGSSCEVGGVFTVKGSGIGIGGSADAFQFVWINQAGDDYYMAQITAQDATNPPSNTVGVMLRDSITPTSRFAYIARSGGNGNQFVFIYRSVAGNATVSVPLVVAGPSLPYWVKIVKVGTQYSAFISATGFAPWMQVGTTVNLGFGVVNAVNGGIAIASANNSVLSTSNVGSFQNGIALPVKLETFTATNIADEYIDTRWTTNMEQLNDHFEVQRSIDGQNFQTIGSVKGAGTTDLPQNYSFQDNHPAQGLDFYRLKQVDLDGKYWYSPTVYTRFGKMSDPIIYPNPASSYFNVETGLEPIRELSIYDVSGKELYRLVNPGGSGSYRISTDAFAPGIYIVRMKTASKLYQKKLIKQ